MPGCNAWVAGCLAIGCHSGCRLFASRAPVDLVLGDRRELCQTPSLPSTPRRDRRFLPSPRRPSSHQRPRLCQRRTDKTEAGQSPTWTLPGRQPRLLRTPHPHRPHTAEHPHRHRTHSGSRPPVGTRVHRPRLSSRSGSPRPVPRASPHRPERRQGTVRTRKHHRRSGMASPPTKLPVTERPVTRRTRRPSSTRLR